MTMGSNSNAGRSIESPPPSSICSNLPMEPTATIQISATPKSPPPKVQQAGAAGVPPLSGFSRLDSPSRIKKLVKSGSGGKQDHMPSFAPKDTLSKQKSFTEEKNSPIEAWYYNPNSEEDPDEKDPTLPHHFKPDQQVPQEHLQELGVLVWTALQTINYKQNQFFEQVKSERGYHYEEVVTVAPGKLANYEQKKKDFFKEHLHEHEEIRLILEGGGYEDIRDFDGHWIRIHITKGVLIVLPKGMYHRFTLDDTNYLKAVLLYQETPSRIQFDRNAGTDIMEVREQYKANVLSRGSSLKGTSSDLSGMLDGLDEELEIFRVRQEAVEASLDESDRYADSVTHSSRLVMPAHPSDVLADLGFVSAPHDAKRKALTAVK